MLKTAINLMAGKGCPEDVDPLSYYRGRYDLYTKVTRPVDNAEEVINNLSKDHDNTGENKEN